MLLTNTWKLNVEIAPTSNNVVFGNSFYQDLGHRKL